MASSLILHKRITTTTAKAKALRSYIEPLITKSKDDTTHSRRVVFSYLKNKYAVSELFREVSPKIMERPGGYTRILKTGNRLGDNAEMCIIELVDYNENMLEDTASKAKSARRRRGPGKQKAEAEVTEASSSAEAKAEVEKATEVEKETLEKEEKAEAKDDKVAEEKAPEKEEEIDAKASTDGEDMQSEPEGQAEDTDKEDDNKE